MTNLVQSLFRIDPTEGLVQYVNAVKPFHSKVLDVLVEYIYSESVKVSIKDRWSWTITLSRPKSDIEYACGYGLTWDPIKTPDSAPQASIINAQSRVMIPINIRTTADPTVLTASQNGVSVTTGMEVTLKSTGTLPASIPQVAIGHTYIVTGHNGRFTLSDPLTHTPIAFHTNGTGTVSIDLADLHFNSFLIAPNYGTTHTIAVTNTRANQCTFVNSYPISLVNAHDKKWSIPQDIRPRYAVTNIFFDNVTLPDVEVAGNCSFVVSGNQEDHFPPGSIFTVFGSTSNDHPFTVSSDSNRPLTRYDGKNTIVPVEESVVKAGLKGTIIIAVSTVAPNGSMFHVLGNTGIGGNGRYTIASSAVVGNVTEIVVNETVSVLASNDGLLHIPVGNSRIPAWPSGIAINFQTTGTFPSPLSNTTRLHYIPTSTPGVFNLSTKRYPTEYDDYVDLASLSTGILSARRAEMFHPGAYIKVSGSYLNKNDKNYIVKQTVNEGDNIRLYVMENVPYTTPLGQAYDGVMEFNFDSYDAPVYCPVSKAPDMHSDTFIHETIMFEYSFNLTDAIMSTISDRKILGYGVMPYGNNHSAQYGTYSGDTKNNTLIVGSNHKSSAGTILPHGIDMQLFGVGGFVETIDSVAENYGKTL